MTPLWIAIGAAIWWTLGVAVALVWTGGWIGNEGVHHRRDFFILLGSVLLIILLWPVTLIGVLRERG